MTEGWPGSGLGLSLLLPHQKPVSRICCYIKNTPHLAVWGNNRVNVFLNVMGQEFRQSGAGDSETSAGRTWTIGNWTLWRVFSLPWHLGWDDSEAGLHGPEHPHAALHALGASQHGHWLPGGSSREGGAGEHMSRGFALFKSDFAFYLCSWLWVGSREM